MRRLCKTTVNTGQKCQCKLFSAGNVVMITTVLCTFNVLFQIYESFLLGISDGAFWLEQELVCTLLLDFRVQTF